MHAHFGIICVYFQILRNNNTRPCYIRTGFNRRIWYKYQLSFRGDTDYFGHIIISTSKSFVSDRERKKENFFIANHM